VAGNKSKKTSTGKDTSNRKKTSSAIHFEIAILMSLAVCILLFLSNFGWIGVIGDVVSGFFFGVFGILAYIMPILIFLFLLFCFLNARKRSMARSKTLTKTAKRERDLQYLRIVLICILVVCVATLSELIAHSYDMEMVTFDFYNRSATLRNGGGLLGGLLVRGFVSLLGVLGTYIVVSIVLLICLIVLSGKPILSLMGNRSKQVYADVRERQKTVNKNKEEKRAKAELERKSQPGKGVMLPSESLISGVENPKVKKKRKSQDMVELTMDDYPGGVAKIKEEPKEEHKVEDSMGIVEPMEQVPFVEVQEVRGDYAIPPLYLLSQGKKVSGSNEVYLRKTAQKLEQTLANFGVRVHVTDASCGPSVTRYELQPEQGVKVSRIVGLADDIKLNLAVSDLRIEAPIPGKAAVGIEVPNQENTAVMLRELLESTEFQKSDSKLSFAVGKDIAGKAVVTDIAKMPHLLIAGATGSGKSVCINTLILSIIYKATPDEVKLIMIDPKVVELSVYNGIPHLLYPVVTDPKKAAGALNWAVAEMTRRYQLFATFQVRNIKGYNDKVAKNQKKNNGEDLEVLPQIVIIVDELADLMMVAPGEVEGAICRLAQLARAAGLHLIVATQRPSVNVITGLIKANMPSRIAFSVTSGVDSRTIIDMNGAEKLLGKGDMLFHPAGYPKPVRVQGSFVSDKEVQKVVDYLEESNKNEEVENKNEIKEEIEEHLNGNVNVEYPGAPGITNDSSNERDRYFAEAGFLIIDKEKASIGMLQRMFKIGFNRAARIMDQLHEVGVVGGEEGTKPRKILMCKEEFEQFLNES